MKHLLWLLFVPSLLAAQVQKPVLQKPDTVQLTPKELFEESDDWNDLGVLESYIDFSKDILSSSNLSIGIIGKQISTTLNLGYSKSSLNGKWGQSLQASLNPTWNYYGAGYGISKNSNSRTSTLQAFGSTDFDFSKDVTLSFIDVHRTKKYGTFGYSIIASKTFWGTYQGEWEGKYTIDENGEFIDVIYPKMPASSELIYRGMAMYTYTFKTKLINISPQVFVMNDTYKTYRDGTASDFSYFNDFNLDMYYGISTNWKITKRFVLNTNFRLNNTIDESSKSSGYKKSNPIMLMVGTQFQF